MPRVSVIIPTYNRADLLAEAIDSVLGQSFQDFELLAVDDGSTDNTAELVASYGPPVRYIYQENRGQGAARNAGLQTARGEYVAFLDSDDLWEPKKLALQVATLDEKRECSLVYSDAYFFDGKTRQRQYLFSRLCRPYEGHVARELLHCNFIASPTPLLRRSVFELVGGFDERRPQLGEDWDLWLRVAAQAPIALVPEVLAGYRQHEVTTINSYSPLIIHDKSMSVIARAAERSPTLYGQWRNEAAAQLCIRTGRMLVSHGDIPTARRLFAQATSYKRTLGLAYLLWATCLAGERPVRAVMSIYRSWRRRASVAAMNAPFVAAPIKSQTPHK